MSNEENKVEKVQNKNPVENITKQFVDAERKKLEERLKTEITDFIKANELAKLAATKAQATRSELLALKPFNFDQELKKFGL